MKRYWLLIGFALLGTVMLGPVSAQEAKEAEEEITIKLSDRDLKRLSIFEDRALSTADAAFAREEYEKAAELYDAFLKKLPKSPVAPYVMFKMAQCSQLDGEADAAVALYEKVAESYPKTIDYAVPALCKAAQCYVDAEKDDAAVEIWTKIATNPDYCKSPLGLNSVAKLTETLIDQGKPAEAKAVFEKMDADFIKANEDLAAKMDELAEQAAAKVVRQYIRDEPNLEKLAALYKELQPEATDELAYWAWVRKHIRANGQFSWSERDKKKEYYEFWLKAMEGKFPESDDFQIGLATIQYAADRDRDKLAETLDAQFKKQKADSARVIQWVRAYKGNWTKIKEYAAMLDYETSGIDGINQLMDVLRNEHHESYLAKNTFAKFCEGIPFDKVSNDDLVKLINLAQGTLEDRTSAKKLADKLKLDGMSEEDKLKLARDLLKLHGEIAEKVYEQMTDKNAGKAELLNPYYENDDVYRGCRVADELIEVEKYADDARKKKAEMLVANKRYLEAIAALKELDQTPANMWKIAECYIALKDDDGAVKQLREIEKAVKDDSAKAAYQIAAVYSDDEEEVEQYVSLLREVTQKYPGTAEAKKAAADAVRAAAAAKSGAKGADGKKGSDVIPAEDLPDLPEEPF